MKQLKFEHRFAEEIVAGKKTATFRVNDDKDIVVGDIVQVIDKVDRDHPTSWVVNGELKITAVVRTPLSQLTSEHMLKAKSFNNIDDLVQTFKRFYGEHINKDTQIVILSFVFEPYDKPKLFLQNIDNSNTVLKKAHLFADGGSRGNPGPSSLGFVVCDLENNVVHSDNKYLGVTTNNQAEYHALIAGMEWCLAHGVRQLDVFLDSMLVVNQMKDIYKVKNRDLWTLYNTSKDLTKKFSSVKFTHIPRELNKLADKEVNKALNAVKGSDIVQ